MSKRIGVILTTALIIVTCGFLLAQTKDANLRLLVPITFANLGTPANGAMAYCSDCTATSPVASGGTGVVVRRENGAWNGGGLPDMSRYPAANCVGTTPGSAYSLPAAATFTPICRAATGRTNNLNGTLQAIPNTGATAYFQFQLPSDWDTAIQPFLKIYYSSGTNVSGTVIWTVSTGCTKSDGSITDDPAFVAEAAMATQTMAVANRNWAQSAQFVNVTSGNNCVAGSLVDLRLVLSGTAAANINLAYSTITVPRKSVVQAN